VSSDGDRPAVVGDGERVSEYRWRARKLAAGSVGREEGRKRGLRGSLGDGGSHGGRRRPFLSKGAHDLSSRAQEGRRKGVKTSLSSREGSRQSRAREGVRRSRPARHSVAVALRRPSSACAQGAAPRGEAERIGRGPVWENPVAWRRFWPGRTAHGRRPRLGRRRTGEGERKERVERERDLSDSNLNLSQIFQLTLKKF
jgi:hypothetical protein